ncbi:MAG: Hsp70 family protein [Polyangiaceae bacterium]
MSDREPIIGIDLGTTYSLVAVLDGDAPRVLPNALGEHLTPSAISVLPSGAILVGAAARARATTHPDQTFLSFKRDMGTERTYQVAGRTFTPQELSALVLSALKKDAEVALGRSINEAVVTVPAYFGDLQRQATRDAGAIAGLAVERIINEPTAAALAYGLHQRSRNVRAVVLDLGGGTFDVTILEIIEGIVEVQASAGDIHLGGDDFDRALAEAIAERIEREHGRYFRDDAVAWARLVAAAEHAKRQLSTAKEGGQVRIALPDLPVARDRKTSVELTIGLDEAEAAWHGLIERLRAPIARALRDASLAPSAIEEVLLVGGATRMACVARLAAQVFGRLPLRALPPDEAVALGAAVQAALKQGNKAVEDLVVTDVAPFSMGVAVVSGFGGQQVDGLFSAILERGTVIPTSRVRRYHANTIGQRAIKLEVYQGERSLCRDNQRLGEILIDGLPTGPERASVDVRFTYDLNGILEVDVSVIGTKTRKVAVLERSPGRLTKAQIAEAQKAMARLKLHPRDALPNTTALARADALHVELVGHERELLATAIATFRAALESQDDALIRDVRARLTELIVSLRR